MGHVVKAVLVVVLLAAAAGIGLYLWREGHPPALPAAAPAPAAEPAQPQGPRHPLTPPFQPDKPLPALNASDAEAREALAGFVPPSMLERLVFEGFIRRVVATIDNLPREQYAARLNPLQPVPGVPKTAGAGDTLTWAPENAARYAPYVAAFDALDAARLADFYSRYYPLFQQAYVELGYPQGYFNDRLVEVIDHLLDTPEVRGPLHVVQPKVLYLFADESLEARSAGQKVLLRLRPENAAKVKAKLRDIRARVARAAP